MIFSQEFMDARLHFKNCLKIKYLKKLSSEETRSRPIRSYFSVRFRGNSWMNIFTLCFSRFSYAQNTKLVFMRHYTVGMCTVLSARSADSSIYMFTTIVWKCILLCTYGVGRVSYLSTRTNGMCYGFFLTTRVKKY